MLQTEAKPARVDSDSKAHKQKSFTGNGKEGDGPFRQVRQVVRAAAGLSALRAFCSESIEPQLESTSLVHTLTSIRVWTAAEDEEVEHGPRATAVRHEQNIVSCPVTVTVWSHVNDAIAAALNQSARNTPHL